MANPPSAYVDACVLISYLEADADRVGEIEELLRRGNGEISLVTSAISQVEVAYIAYEKAQQQLDADAEAKIDALWQPGSVIGVVEFYPRLALDARTLIRSAVAQGMQLKPNDAMHLATAMRVGCDDFFTYDEKLPPYADLTQLTIGPPTNPQTQLGV